MKKSLRLIVSLMLSVLMLASFGMTAFATASDTPTTYKITVTKADGDKTVHTYEAYQIFSGKLVDAATSDVLTNVGEGSGVNFTTLLTKLKADETVVDTTENKKLKDFFPNDSYTAEEIAKVFDQKADNSLFAKRLAAAVGASLKENRAAGSVIIAADATSGDITGLTPGYYLVKDKDETQKQQNGNYTRYILKVVRNVTATAKAEIPTLDKKIVENNQEVPANTASIGDTVKFRINTAVPAKAADFNKYYFIINDTLCTGLTFQPTSVKVYSKASTADEYTLLDSEKYTVKVANIDTDTFRVVLHNAKSYAGQNIRVEYNAVLNENCDRTVAGNENIANLTYSNDPNFDYEGENEPTNTEDKVTGFTPDVNTKTYTTGIKILKIDGETKERLTGATFEISGQKVNQVITVAETYAQDADGTYYKLKDGSYTETAPTPQTEGQYASTTVKYKLTKNEVTKNSEGTDLKKVSAAVDAQGYLTFEGLGKGTYYIKETAAPANYNQILEPFTVVIDADPNLTAPNWEVGDSTDNLQTVTTLVDNMFVKELKIENNKGVILPGTGGIGTTVFYVVGGVLILCAGVLLVTKIRMNQKDK